MNLDRPALDAAVAKSIVTPEQADLLWRFLAERGEDVPRFRFGHVLYYLGGLVAIGAMTLFMNVGWERFGGFGILTIASAYFLLALVATSYFNTHAYAVPAGIAGALAVVALSANGLVVIGLGILWQRHEAAVATKLRSLLPLPLRQLIERRA